MPAGFSRLQLAAALLEYDNDSDDPDAPRRYAQESAIFAHFRRNPTATPRTAPRQSDYLGISLPSETGSLGGRESVPGTRRSRGSIDALRNPFGADSNDGEEEAEGNMEVDLTSWGLDAFMPKDKSRKGKGRAPSVAATAPPTTTVRSHLLSTGSEQAFLAPRRAISYSRSLSLGGSVDFLRQTGNAPADLRRRSIASPLDVANMEVNHAAFPRQRSSSISIMPDTAESSSQGVPFPTGSTRATSPGPSESVSGRRAHSRTFSVASMNSKMMLGDVKEESRPQSIYYEDEEAPPQEDNPFALKPPSHTSRFDPKYGAHARTMSNASLGTRALLNDDQESIMTGAGGDFTRDRRYSTTLDLLRPKVLVMPSPLQLTASPGLSLIDSRIRDGFTLSKDGPPLPPGARTSRRTSILLDLSDTAPPIASNSFTPNPLGDLSISQQLFRNTLAVDGQFDAFPSDLPRATEEGEQAQLYPEELEPEESVPPSLHPEASAPKRLPGKLYGKSLIDDLEARKAQMRSKKRVFYGDQRPSMMARGDMQRGSTLIDPATLGRPTPQILHHSTSGEGLTQRNSVNIKPLLSFENDKIPQTAPMPGRPVNSQSVFGVDRLWEREMEKLHEIEAQEKFEEEERKRQEEEEERQRSEKKSKKKRKGKKHGEDTTFLSPDSFVAAETNVGPRVSSEPPILPSIERASRRPPPPTGDDDDDESEDEDIPVMSTQQAPQLAWHAGSSDEENDPRRTTGVGPRFPTRQRVSHPPADAESDEDVPLATTLRRAFQQNTNLQPQQFSQPEDDDEERPLSSLLEKAKVKKTPSSVLDVNFDQVSVMDGARNKAEDDEDDNQPLGLRASRISSGFNNRGGSSGDDDDRPLGLHPEQQRRTHYGMFAQQQQQMMMQAQLQNSIIFNSSVMGSGIFPPAMAAPMMAPMNNMMMMQPPVPIPSPPPVHDAAKFGRVDKWRRDVAVEGER